MCGGSKGTNTSTTTTTPPADVLAAYRNVMNKAQGAANLPYTGAPVDIAGFTPDQMNAFQSVNNAQGMATPFFNTAANYGGIGGANISDQTPLLSDNTNAQLASSASNQFTGGTPNYLMSALAALPMMMGMTGAGQSPYGGMPPGTYAPPQSGYNMTLPPGTFTGSGGGYGGLPPGTWMGNTGNLPPGTFTGSSGQLPPGTFTGSSGQLPPGTFTGSSGQLPPGISGGSLSDVTGGMVPGVDASTISQYMSPYTQNVVDATQKQFANQNEQARQGLVGNAISAGAWGGDRAGIAQAELANQQQLAQAPVIAGLYNQGYGQALSEANQQQQTGLAKAGLSLQQMQALGQLGLGQQQADTSRLSATGQLGLGQQQADISRMGTSGQLGLGQQQADISRMGTSGQLGLGQQQADISRMGTTGQLGLGQQQADISRMGTSGQLGLGQENYGLGLMGTSGQLSLGQQGVGLNQANQALQALQLGMSGSQSQDQMALQRAQLAAGMYGQNAQLANQSAYQSGQLGLGAGQLFGNLGMNAQQAALAQASAQLQTGGMQQQLQQEWNNVQNANYMAGQQWPFTTSQFLAGIAGSMAGGMGGTSTQQTPQPSLLSQIGGLGMTGLGVIGGTGGFGATGWLTGLLADGGRVGLDAGGRTPGGPVTEDNVLRPHGGHGPAPSVPQLSMPAGIPVTAGTPGAMAVPNFNGSGVNFNPAPAPPVQQGGMGPISPDVMATIMQNLGPAAMPTDAAAAPTPGIPTPANDFKMHSLMSAARGHFAFGGGTDDEDDEDYDDGLNLDATTFNPAMARADREDKEQMRFTGVSPVNATAQQAVFHAPDLPTAGGGISAPPAGIPDTSNGSSAAIAATQNKLMPAMLKAPEPASPQDPQMEGAVQAAQAAGEAANDAVADEKGKKNGKADGWDKFTNSPWMALVAAGLGTMAGTSPNALTNFGTGGEQALKVIKEQREDREKRDTAEARLKVLQSNANLNAKRFLETQKKNEADAARADKRDDPTYIQTRAAATSQGTREGQIAAGPVPITLQQQEQNKQAWARINKEAPEKYSNPTVIEADGPNGERQEVLGVYDKKTLQWMTADESKTPLDNVMFIEKTPGGGRTAAQVQRVISGAKNTVTGLNNITTLPISAGTSTFGGEGQKLNLWDASKQYLSKQLTPQEVQSANASFIGLSMAMGTLDSGGLQVSDAFRNQIDEYKFTTADTYLTKLRKIAEMAQIADNSAETLLNGPLLSKDQKVYVKELRNALKSAVPWTPNDVTKLESSKNPNASIKDYAKKIGLSGSSEAPAADESRVRTGASAAPQRAPNAPAASAGQPTPAAVPGAVPLPKGAINDPDGTPYQKGGVDYVKKGDHLVPKNALPAAAAPKAEAPAATAPAPPPAVGAIRNGYKFLGGDPKDKASWARVQ